MIYGTVVGACWIVFIIYWLVSAASAKRTLSTRGWRWSWSVRVVLAAAVIFVASSVAPGFFARANNYLLFIPGIQAAGTLLVVAGVAFAIWARAYLGSNWGMPMSIKENAELVTSGPYRYVRHPIYTGIFFAVLGSILAAGLFWAIMVVFMIPYFFFAAREEEVSMLARFPSQYPDYKKKTKMFIPFVL